MTELTGKHVFAITASAFAVTAPMPVLAPVTMLVFMAG